jgi:ubiquinone/menaquinone biosynthesis C-methylase UbiE
VLEVAPGPGYLAIGLARRGAFRIAGLDISHSFVRIATQNAARAGVEIAFRQGDAAAMPYPEQSFDFVVCRAAFKNFSDPVGALREMHRVLRPGGEALIIDMRCDASNAAIDERVAAMKLGPLNAFFVRAVFKLRAGSLNFDSAVDSQMGRTMRILCRDSDGGDDGAGLQPGFAGSGD